MKARSFLAARGMTALSNPAAPKSLSTAFQRWELDSFDQPANEPVVATLPSAAMLERIHEQAQQEGFDVGYREGNAKAAAEAARLQQVLAALTDESQQFDQHLANELLALALVISKQVLRQALELHPELILAVIHEVLGQTPHTQRRAQLFLHPEDAALVRNHIGDQLTRSGWDVIEDGAILRGGCRLRSSECDIDATLEGRWKRVAAAIGSEHAWIA